MKKSDFSIDLDNQVLSISSEKKNEQGFKENTLQEENLDIRLLKEHLHYQRPLKLI